MGAREPKPEGDFLISVMPFCGFYESQISQAIDLEEERHIEDRVSESDRDTDEKSWPEELRLSANDLSGLYIEHTSYDIAYNALARDYLDAFDIILGELFGKTRPGTRKEYRSGEFVDVACEYDSAGLKFESTDSPREYNFTTDRLYAYIPTALVRELFELSAAKGHKTFSAVIKERFTSCSGFISHYPNDLESWLGRDLEEWDHNEILTLLLAAIAIKGESKDAVRDMEDSAIALTIEDDGPYKAWEKAVDWEALDAAILESRGEKLAEWIADDPDTAAVWLGWNVETAAPLLKAAGVTLESAGYVLPFRCSSTPDLFAGTIWAGPEKPVFIPISRH